ncbi:MAG: sulfite reductase, partial [Microthrixaceae bacterium]
GPDGSPGAVFVVGGGLGRSHKDPSTFPRLGDHLCWVPEEEIGQVAEAVVTLFRDHGNREDRSHARLKYVVEDRGVEWVREEVERRVGHALADPVELPPWGGARDHLGWHRQAEDTWFLGLPVPSGRLEDRPGRRRRSAIRRILEDHANEVRITPHDNILLCGIRGDDRAAVERILGSHGVPRVDELRITEVATMACPALPTCGQALGEAERVLPDLVDVLDALLVERGLGELRIETRMTGCPNGCARPYVAELGIVARTKSNYDVWVGGDASGTRLARPLVENVPFGSLGELLAVVLDRFVAERRSGEPFGDWTDRIGTEVLAADLPSFERRRREVA